MKQEIKAKLAEIKEETGFRLLIALESGSRAWGFPSPDSDYDVRFIFARKPEEYLSIQELNESMDLPINDLLDINGWDVRKTLRLAGRSNATPFEWLQSPILYLEEEGMQQRLWNAIAPQFCARSTAAHYFGLTHGSLEKLKSQGERHKIKTWFYVLRPLFAAEWCLAKRTIPPMEFAPLREMTKDAELEATIDELLLQKKDASEAEFIDAPTDLLEQMVQRVATGRARLDQLEKRPASPDQLDSSFREILACAP